MRGSNGSGSTRSPMPVTRARPPTRQNGTSAPRPTATSRSVDAGPAQHRGGVGGPAAEAGAGGDALVDGDVRGAPDGAQGPRDEVVVVGRHVGAGAPHHRARRRRRR